MHGYSKQANSSLSVSTSKEDPVLVQEVLSLLSHHYLQSGGGLLQLSKVMAVLQSTEAISFLSLHSFVSEENPWQSYVSNH